MDRYKIHGCLRLKAAAIDIGTNTLLMLIADISADNIDTIADYHDIARLGEGLKKSNIISANACDRAKSILSKYRTECDKYNIDKIRICGTSALRDARNSNEIIEQLSSVIKAPIEIISGEEEAELSYIGSIGDDNQNILIDIGGGSTEFIIGNDKEIIFKESMNIGAVKITEMFFNSQPPTDSEIQSAQNYINNSITKITNDISSHTIYAVAGTPTTMAAVILDLKSFDADRIDGFKMNSDMIAECVHIFSEADLPTLVNKYHIHPQRADLMLAGSLILQSILQKIHIEHINVSTKGLRYGIMYSLINK